MLCPARGVVMVTDDVAPAATPVSSADAAARTAATRQTPVFNVDLLLVRLGSARRGARVRSGSHFPHREQNQTATILIDLSIDISPGPRRDAAAYDGHEALLGARRGRGDPASHERCGSQPLEP